MRWREKWEEFKESLTHHEKEWERPTAEERRAQAERHEAALHRTDRSTGSETLDD